MFYWTMPLAVQHSWYLMMMMVMVVVMVVPIAGKQYEQKSHGVPAAMAPFLIKTSTKSSLLQCGYECDLKSCELLHYDSDSTSCSIYSVYMSGGSHAGEVYAIAGAMDRRSCFTDAVKLFTGTLSMTSTNKMCQRWDSQSPHPHPYTQSHMFPDATVAGASNYCRDPSGSGYLWCYTTDPDGGGEPCSVYKCSVEGCPFVDPRTYRATLSVTISNRQCQRWDSQSPNSHHYKADSHYPDSTVSDAENYCRDPNNEVGILWCYTTSGGRSDLCDPFLYSHTGSYTIDTSLYTGTLNVTGAGKTCQRWDVQNPTNHPHTDASMFPDATVSDAHNYCRDPDNRGYLWCYRADGTKWNYACNIYKC